MALLEFGYPRKELRSQMTWFASWLAVTTIGAVLTPDKSGHGTHQQLGLPPCPSVLVFDRPCPGCGLTTSWTAFIHGNFAEAFHAHPLGPPLYLLYTFTAVLSLFGFARGARFGSDSKEFTYITWTAVSIFMTFGIVRMAITPHFGTAAEHVMASYSGK